MDVGAKGPVARKNIANASTAESNAHKDASVMGVKITIILNKSKNKLLI